MCRLSLSTEFTFQFFKVETFRRIFEVAHYTNLQLLRIKINPKQRTQRSQRKFFVLQRFWKNFIGCPEYIRKHARIGISLHDLCFFLFSQRVGRWYIIVIVGVGYRCSLNDIQRDEAFVIRMVKYVPRICIAKVWLFFSRAGIQIESCY